MMDIVECSDQYLDQIIDLFIAVFNAPPWNDQWTRETASEYLTCIMGNRYFMGLCCIENDRVAGFLIGHCEYWYTGETFHIQELCVSNSSQQRGYGSKLLGALETILQAKGIQSIFLLTERNSIAEKFYSKNGYHKNEKLGAMGKKISGGS